MEQRYVPSSAREDEDEAQAEPAEEAPVVAEKEVETPTEPRSGAHAPRKRRRAVSTGVITPV